MSLKEIALKRENAWREYALSPSYLADFALSELCDLDVDKYVLKEILSRTAIEALLAYSSNSINACRTGQVLSSFGSGGVTTRPVDEGRKLETLLRTWAEKGWISIWEVGGENSLNASFVDGAPGPR